MWIKILNNSLKHKPLHAVVRESDGKLFFLGSDVAKIYKYKNTEQFNRQYSNIQLRDILRPELLKYTRLHETWLIDFETLNDRFYGRRETRVLRRMLVEKRDGGSEVAITEFSGSYRPSLDKKKARIIKVADKWFEGYDFESFIKSFHKQTRKMINRTTGILELHAAEDSREEDAPDNCIVVFGDGRRVTYKKMKSEYSDTENDDD